jgi:hypothetical protein
VNDAPVLTIPGAQATPEDVAITITGVSVADVDVGESTGVVKVTVSVGSGRLTIATGAAGGLSAADVAGNGTAAVVLQGPLASVNATLAAGITYLGDVNFNGTDTMTVVADDLGGTGAGGALTDTETVSIHVLSPAEQIADLWGMVSALYADAVLGQGNANALLKKLNSAQAELDKGKPKGAYAAVASFSNQVQSLVATGVLTSAAAGPLLSAAELLLQSLRVGGGF